MSRVMIRLLSARQSLRDLVGAPRIRPLSFAAQRVLPAQCPFLPASPTFGRTARFKPVVLGIADRRSRLAQEDVWRHAFVDESGNLRDQALVLPGGIRSNPSRVRLGAERIAALRQVPYLAG